MSGQLLKHINVVLLCFQVHIYHSKFGTYIPNVVNNKNDIG